MRLFVYGLAWLFHSIYGYEGLNLLFRVSPSRYTILILKRYGAAIGDRVRILNPMTIHAAKLNSLIFSNLIIGDDVFIGRHSFFDLSDTVNIGNRVTISHMFSTHTHEDAGKSLLAVDIIKPSYGKVNIGDDAYIGVGVTILKNVTIGKSTIVAAGSLVKDSFPNGIMVAGVPAVEKKKLKRGF